MNSNTEGNCNTAVGRKALVINTTGDKNTAFGHTALGGLTTGNENTGVGFDVMNSTVTGTGNTAVGHGNMSSLTSGATNTSIGNSATPVLTTGSNNTTAGDASGISLTSGVNNLLLGHDAGRSGSPGGTISTGSNQIVLGDESISSAYIQVDWTVTSDQRDKTDFNNLDLGLDFVNKLNPVTYKWDKRSKYNKDLSVTPTGEHKEDWLDIGFKAQEVEALEIEAGYNKDNKTNLTVKQTEDGKQYGIQYAKFVPVLVKAIQELTKRIKDLEDK
jgi:hypothetical protein